MLSPLRCLQLIFPCILLVNFLTLVYIWQLSENVAYLTRKMDRLLADGKNQGSDINKRLFDKDTVNHDLDSFQFGKGEEPARIPVARLQKMNSWMGLDKKSREKRSAPTGASENEAVGKAYRVIKEPVGKDFRVVKVEEITHTPKVVKNNNAKTIANMSNTKSNVDTYLPELGGENIISMSLWGRDRRYTIGAVRNAELLPEFFPGWKMRIYTEAASEHRMFEAIPSDILDKLKSLGVDIQFVSPSETRVPPMMWRFMVADDMSIDRFLVRDTDSRLSARDAVAVWAWEQSGKALHCIRDHPSHTGYALNGGMWGGKPTALRNILRRSWSELMYGYRPDYLQDMAFLRDIIWPRVKAHAHCSDSQSCDKWPGSHPFPIRRYGYEHVGQVYDANDLSRPVDIRLLRQARDNPKCVPPV